MKGIIIGVYTCDIWKSYESMHELGFFSNERKLRTFIRKLIKDETVDINENCNKKDVKEAIDNLDLSALNNQLDYFYIKEIYLSK